MKARPMVVPLVLLAALVTARRAEAAAPLSVGVGVSQASKTGVSGGGRAVWGENPALAVGVDRWLPKEEAGLRAASWEAHVSAVFHLRARRYALRPYVGVGGSFVRTTGEVTLVAWDVSGAQWSRGANVLAGFDLRLARRYDAYAEARGQIWGQRQVVVTAGLRLALIRSPRPTS